MDGATHHTPDRGRIEIKVRSIDQLFETMDPSPFIEKDLDPEAETFIVSWARELPRSVPLALAIHVSEKPALESSEDDIEQAVRNYFAYRKKLARNQFRQLMRTGRMSALIGVLFLIACLFTSEALGSAANGSTGRILSESFIIIGWVAMWRPLEIFLYDWWPLRATERLFERLSRIDVEVIPGWVSARS
ncbi:MAG: hypothetical protein HUU29_09450 [Planctomycetaceae bacterium]|nr:hypothetical protein [Planctomycetaceae bacterium]